MTIIPPPNGTRDHDTNPPDRSTDSTTPPADFGPAAMELRMLALEEQVSDIHLETSGASGALEDIKATLRLITMQLEVVLKDAQGQRRDRANTRTDLDELTRRVVALEGRSIHEVRNGKP